MEKELKKMTNEQLVEVYKYYKPKAKRLGKEEYKYLIAIEREINKRNKADDKTKKIYIDCY